MVLAAVAVATAVAASGALAAGGTSIATAPIVQFGVQEFGNTASDALGADNNLPTPGNDFGCLYSGWLDGSGVEFWMLNLISGDQVLVKGNQVAPANNLTVEVLPRGTTDVTVTNQTQTLVNNDLQDANTFTAPSTGSYPLVIGGGCPDGSTADGPFSFVVTVLHKALLFLQPEASVRLAGHLQAVVRTPDGHPITDKTLKLTVYGIWKNVSYAPATSHKLETTSPVGGIARFNFNLPRALVNKPILLRVTGSGASYQPIRGVTLSVHVVG